jgi:hypothetical protein
MKKVGVTITAAGQCASHVGRHAFARRLFAAGFRPEFRGHGAQIVFIQSGRARHQGDVRVPEAAGLHALHQLRRATRDFAARDRPVPVYVAHTVAEAVADVGDALVGGAAVPAVVAAVFDQRDIGIGRTQDMVVCLVDRAIEPARGLQRGIRGHSDSGKGLDRQSISQHGRLRQ